MKPSPPKGDCTWTIAKSGCVRGPSYPLARHAQSLFGTLFAHTALEKLYSRFLVQHSTITKSTPLVIVDVCTLTILVQRTTITTYVLGDCPRQMGAFTFGTHLAITAILGDCPRRMCPLTFCTAFNHYQSVPKSAFGNGWT
jgi:hypothetical protein